MNFYRIESPIKWRNERLKSGRIACEAEEAAALVATGSLVLEGPVDAESDPNHDPGIQSDDGGLDTAAGDQSDSDGSDAAADSSADEAVAEPAPEEPAQKEAPAKAPRKRSSPARKSTAGAK